MSESRTPVRSIDPQTLPKHFEADSVEERWDRTWQESGVYHYDPERSREETFVVDTPPPTASGSLHIGHVFSYTQADVVVRYKRMTGMNVFYPMGWDDNGLPTERRVQNYFHIRCDPNTPYQEGMTFEQASSKTRKKPAQLVSRPNFIEACYDLIKEDEEAFSVLWHRMGLAVDWRQEYQTIDEHCRRTAQRSFRDLFDKDHVYTSDAPTMWDVDFQCAVAQAEIEDKDVPGAFHKIEFAVEGEDASFVIATTRPELLPACVAVTAHPDDERFKPFFGKRAITPIFRAPVPIFPSELADPEKGTGILMVCTFGDQTDVQWWREEGLPLRQVLGLQGRLRPVDFGEAPFESLDVATANANYAELEGKNVKQAQASIVEMLRDPAQRDRQRRSAPGRSRADLPRGQVLREGRSPARAPADAAMVLSAPRQEGAARREGPGSDLASAAHVRALPRLDGEPLPRLVPLAPAFLRRADPGLVSARCGRRARLREPDRGRRSRRAAGRSDDRRPAGLRGRQRGQPGGFVGEADIFDTWFTSSMTPQISSHWGEDEARHAKLFPADMRPQAHDIIRTWAFYTIAKAMLHEDDVPWRNALISGWILDPDRKKMSKSKGNVTTPLPLIEKYTADAARYWAASARLGSDTAFDENVWKIGKRLVTKIFNAAKFVLAQRARSRRSRTSSTAPSWRSCAALVEDATKNFDAYQYAHALQETESFFWTHFTDTYLELAKVRARGFADGARGDEAAESGSAVASLRLGLSVLLRLFAPVLPYITEEVWSWAFADETAPDGDAAARSVHAAAWPSASDFANVEAPADEKSFEAAVAALAAINKAKADAEVSMGREVESLTLAAEPATLETLRGVVADVLSAARVAEHALVENASLEAGAFEVQAIAFAPKPEKKS